MNESKTVSDFFTIKSGLQASAVRYLEILKVMKRLEVSGSLNQVHETLTKAMKFEIQEEKKGRQLYFMA